MLYLLLNAASITAPTATPIPSPTAFPISVAEDLTGLPMWLEELGIWASVILGGAALLISIFALVKTLQQNKHEEKIAVLDNAFEIYHFFLAETEHITLDGVRKPREDFIGKTRHVLYMARILFNEKTYKMINSLMDFVIEADCYFVSYEKRDKEESIKWFIKMAKRENLINEICMPIYNSFNKPLEELHVIQQGILVASNIMLRIDTIYDKYRLNL